MTVRLLKKASLCLDARIRDARLDDLDALVALLHDLFSIEADFVADEDNQRQGLLLMIEGCTGHQCVKVAEIQDMVVGMCTAQTLISTAEGARVAMIEDMVVHRDFRGRGVGRRLMAAITSWARSQGSVRLQLLADRTNFSALDFYDKIGWLPTRLICLRRKWKNRDQ